MHQGLGDPANYGPNAPVTVRALLKMLQEHRKRGFSMIQELYAPRMNSMAAVVRRRGEPATGALIIAGRSSRFTEERMLHFGPSLIRMADELALIGSASPLLKPAALPGSLRHPVSGRDPQEGDDDDRDSSFWWGRS